MIFIYLVSCENQSNFKKSEKNKRHKYCKNCKGIWYLRELEILDKKIKYTINNIYKL